MIDDLQALDFYGNFDLFHIAEPYNHEPYNLWLDCSSENSGYVLFSCSTHNETDVQ